MKYSGLLLLLIFLGCREYYEPPTLKHNPSFLVVVEGDQNTLIPLFETGNGV
jgi:hypothetical protein